MDDMKPQVAEKPVSEGEYAVYMVSQIVDNLKECYSDWKWFASELKKSLAREEKLKREIERLKLDLIKQK